MLMVATSSSTWSSTFCCGNGIPNFYRQLHSSYSHHLTSSSSSLSSSTNLVLNHGGRRNGNHNHSRRSYFNVTPSSAVYDDNQCSELDEANNDTSSGSSSGGVGGNGETPELVDQATPNNGILTAALRSISLPQGEANSAIISACLVGLLTGCGVVLFNSVVHELRDFFWDGVLYRGASWLREEPLEETWKRTISVPVCGGVIVAGLNFLRDGLDTPEQGDFRNIPRIWAVLQQFLKSLAACVTLGTGKSLGPEGPSVETGSSIGKGVASLFGRGTGIKVPLVAAGSAAGIASGWNQSFNYIL